MLSTSALQHLQAKKFGEPPKDSNLSGNLTTVESAAAKTKESATVDSNLPMAVVPSLPSVPAKLVKQIQSGAFL